MWDSHDLVLFQFCLSGINDDGADRAGEGGRPAHPEQRGAPVTGSLSGRSNRADPTKYGAQNGTAEKKFAHVLSRREGSTVPRGNRKGDGVDPVLACEYRQSLLDTPGSRFRGFGRDDRFDVGPLVRIGQCEERVEGARCDKCSAEVIRNL